MLCVEKYLRRHLTFPFYHHQIEHAFVGIKWPLPSTRAGYVPDDEDIVSICHTRLRTQLISEAKHTVESRHMEYMVSLSLPFLSHALTLDIDKFQRQVSAHVHYDSQKQCLSTALDRLSLRIKDEEEDLINEYIQDVQDYIQDVQEYIQDVQDGLPLFNDVVEKPNEGWLWANYDYNHSVDFNIRYMVRDMGFVFWDSKRLRNNHFVNNR